MFQTEDGQWNCYGSDTGSLENRLQQSNRSRSENEVDVLKRLVFTFENNEDEYLNTIQFDKLLRKTKRKMRKLGKSSWSSSELILLKIILQRF